MRENKNFEEEKELEKPCNQLIIDEEAGDSAYII